MLDIKAEADLALAAMRRAALLVAQRAKKDNLPLPIWRNGRIVHDWPKGTPEQVSSAKCEEPR